MGTAMATPFILPGCKSGMTPSVMPGSTRHPEAGAVRTGSRIKSGMTAMRSGMTAMRSGSTAMKSRTTAIKSGMTTLEFGITT